MVSTVTSLCFSLSFLTLLLSHYSHLSSLFFSPIIILTMYSAISFLMYTSHSISLSPSMFLSYCLDMIFILIPFISLSYCHYLSLSCIFLLTLFPLSFFSLYCLLLLSFFSLSFLFYFSHSFLSYFSLSFLLSFSGELQLASQMQSESDQDPNMIHPKMKVRVHVYFYQ